MAVGSRLFNPTMKPILELFPRQIACCGAPIFDLILPFSRVEWAAIQVKSKE
jgi:hypothetical protein